MTIKQKVLNWCKRPFANHPFAFVQTQEEFEEQAKFIEGVITKVVQKI